MMSLRTSTLGVIILSLFFIAPLEAANNKKITKQKHSVVNNKERKISKRAIKPAKRREIFSINKDVAPQ